MKKIYCMLGLIFPALATKVLAQDLAVTQFNYGDLSEDSSLEASVSKELERKLELYEQSNSEERASFIKSIYLQKNEGKVPALEIEIMDRRIRDILEQPSAVQKKTILEMNRRGGILWGKVTDPTGGIG